MCVCECERLRVSARVWMREIVGKPALLLSTGRKQRFEKSVELEQRGNVMKRDVSPVATAPHTPPPTPI